MTRYTVTITHHSVRFTGEREAETAFDAAESALRGSHAQAWVSEPSASVKARMDARGRWSFAGLLGSRAEYEIEVSL